MQNPNSYSTDGKTVEEVFNDGVFYDSNLGSVVRDWYLIERGALDVPCPTDRGIDPFTYVLRIKDLVSGMPILSEPMTYTVPPAKYLGDLLNKGIKQYGAPRKGVILCPTVWAPLKHIQGSVLSRYADTSSLVKYETDFGELPLAARAEFERFIDHLGLACAFTLDHLRGGQVVDALGTSGFETRPGVN